MQNAKLKNKKTDCIGNGILQYASCPYIALFKTTAGLLAVNNQHFYFTISDIICESCDEMVELEVLEAMGKMWHLECFK